MVTLVRRARAILLSDAGIRVIAIVLAGAIGVERGMRF
jgi:hypothetical protein